VKTCLLFGTIDELSAYIQNIETGFVKEMRTVAMKLHTREQAPKEGQQQDAPKPKAVRSSLFS
jgi:hypothetical protein